MHKRQKTKTIYVKDVPIGGDFPITIQSMTTTDTKDIESTVAQINELVEEGCEIVRLAILDKEAAEAFGQIRQKIDSVPLVADIHFDYRLALEAIKNGADAIRINPGNIGDEKRIRAVVEAAKEHKKPIRVGVNSGSLERKLVDKWGGVCGKALAESAIINVQTLEKMGFSDIVISVKSSNVLHTIEANQMLSKQFNYPLHIGITEAGTLYNGIIKSTAGIAALLAQGIGDTIRISLTANPIEEVRAAKVLLQSLQLRVFGAEVISCPTCGRTEIDLIPIANEIQEKVKHIKKPMRIAIMGCVVNGPGEAREADIGIAGGKGYGLLFKKGKIIKKLDESELIPALLAEIEIMEKEG